MAVYPLCWDFRLEEAPGATVHDQASFLQACAAFLRQGLRERRWTYWVAQHNLIDEYRIAVNPVILSEGTPLFKPHIGRRELRLLDTRIFGSGIVELRYAPDQVNSSEYS